MVAVRQLLSSLQSWSTCKLQFNVFVFFSPVSRSHCVCMSLCALICSYNKTITLLPIIAIPHHPQTSDAEMKQCPARKLHPWLECDCATQGVKGMHSSHWHSIITADEGWAPYFRNNPGVGVILDRLKCHYSQATLDAFWEYEVNPLYLYASKCTRLGCWVLCVWFLSPLFGCKSICHFPQ
jgi:hypothetical protein